MICHHKFILYFSSFFSIWLSIIYHNGRLNSFCDTVVRIRVQMYLRAIATFSRWRSIFGYSTPKRVAWLLSLGVATYHNAGGDKVGRVGFVAAALVEAV